MTTLRVILDQLAAPVPGGIGRYTEELTRQLVTTAPADCEVEGMTSALTNAQASEIEAKVPGLAGLRQSVLPRRGLATAWQFGIAVTTKHSMIHAPSLCAPLRHHDHVNNPGDQIAVTIHDVVPWTNPETLTKRGVAWHKAMAKRAKKYADAIIVPTHAVAHELAEILRVDDRIRVIGGAASSSLAVPSDAHARAQALDLPAEYIVSVGTLEPRKGLRELIQALALPDAPDLPLVVVGPTGWGGIDVAAVAYDAGLREGRVRTLGFVSDTDLAVVLDRATVFVYPSFAEGFGLPVIEAFCLGTPVIHSDAPALVEVGAEASLVVERSGSGYPERIAHALTRVATDHDLAMQLSVAGRDRARAFSWRDSAERVWQLHADL